MKVEINAGKFNITDKNVVISRDLYELMKAVFEEKTVLYEHPYADGRHILSYSFKVFNTDQDLVNDMIVKYNNIHKDEIYKYEKLANKYNDLIKEMDRLKSRSLFERICNL